MSTSVFDAKVHFIAGKGGVGKTLIAQALAHHFAGGKKTLLIELSEEEAGDEQPKLALIKEHGSKKFSHIKIFPDQTLYEYLTLKIAQKTLLDSFMSQTLFRALSSAMPGLADLTRLGKIWFHADAEHEPKGEIYEKIVVDMPSSGFVARFLSIARVVSEAVRIGPLAKEAKVIKEYFEDAKNARLHVVALPQELVVNETIELIHEIKRAKGVHLGYAFMNRIFLADVWPAPAESGAEIAKVMNYCIARRDAEILEVARLKKSEPKLPVLYFLDRIGEMHEELIVADMAATFAREQKS